jgi:hypothetical protein
MTLDRIVTTILDITTCPADVIALVWSKEQSSNFSVPQRVRLSSVINAKATLCLINQNQRQQMRFAALNNKYQLALS